MGRKAVGGSGGKAGGAGEERGYQDLFGELEKTVLELEREDLPLERAVSLFRKGVEISRELARRLEETEQRVYRLVEESGGGFGLAPVEPESLGPAGNDSGIGEEGNSID